MANKSQRKQGNQLWREKISCSKESTVINEGDLKTQNEQPVMMIRRGRGQNAKNG